MSSLARTFSSPFNSKAAQGARKFMSLQASNASKTLTNEIQELFKERTMTKKRKKIVNEIIESEKSYQHHLQLLITLFLIPIKVGSLLSKTAIDAIFGNIEGIWSVNQQLLELMETEDVASALYKLAPFMKMYSLYANNFEKSSKTIEEQERKNQHFLAFKESQENKEEMQGLKLRALLITPIQRIPRYKLLLDTLLEKTSPDHPDYKKLRDACAEVSNVATHINECLRLHENFNKMLSIQNSLIGDSAPRILAPGRKFLREGLLSKVCDRGGSKDRMFFLFNDILIYARKETTCTYTCRGVFPLINCIVEQVMGGTRGPSEGGALFKIFCKGKTLLLFSTSKQNARSWIRDIKNAISELHTNLASLRRGDTDPFTPPDAAFVRDSKMRRSKAAKELLKKNNPLSPMQQLRNCTSPQQDILYPMRKDILPQLTEHFSDPKFDPLEDRPKFALQNCINSGKKERNWKPKLRRLQLEDSVAQTLAEQKDPDEKVPTENTKGYILRPRKRPYGAITEKCIKPPTTYPAVRRNRGSQNRRLIDEEGERHFPNSSPGCFGSAKKARTSGDEAYVIGGVSSHERSLAEKTRNVNCEENEIQGLEIQQPTPNETDEVHQGEKNVSTRLYYQGLHLKRTEQSSPKNNPKIWSLKDENTVIKRKQRKGIIYQAKTKVLKARRRRRQMIGSASNSNVGASSAVTYLKSNVNLLHGTDGTFKSAGTPEKDLQTFPENGSEKTHASCILM